MMATNAAVTVRIEVIQRTGADEAEQLAAREVETQNPGFRAVAVRWLGADPFDRYLGGRWVELEVDLLAA